MSSQIPQAVTWSLGAGLLVAAGLLIRQWLTARSRARALAGLREAIRARDEEAHRLATRQLPSLAHSAVASPVPADPVTVDPLLAGTDYERSLLAVAEQFRGAVEQAQARADQNAKSALKSAMRSLQGLANEQQVAISEMQERHDQPAVLRDLLEIDHANSQFGRRAQAIAVLCGSWPGRQRAASSLSDVVRGAKSRVRDYKRVEVRTQIDLAVVSRAVEPVVLAVAELLDNAARHSQPNTTVEVNLQPAHNGACIVIDDAGVGMDPREAQFAGQLLTGQRTVDVTRLGDPPQFGFAVIGVLAARYGFGVSVDTRSPYGGVRAVVFLPTALLSQMAPEPAVAPAYGAPQHSVAPQTAPQHTAAPQNAPQHTVTPQTTPQHSVAPQAAAQPAAAQHPAPRQPAPQPAAAHGAAFGHQPAAGAGAGESTPAQGSLGFNNRGYGRPAPLPPRPAPQLPHTPQPPHAAPVTATTPAPRTAGGLPKRRRREPLDEAQLAEAQQAAEEFGGAAPAAELPAEWTRDAQATARRLGAFARGTRAGRESEPDLPPPGYGRHAARPDGTTSDDPFTG
ncbi:ATP-binding protein [Kitasatospora sp. NPDC008050]|uniref:ATP-binding protein n=1 Tax=Kitasatospora sp. NPDC008050 TaxID=3364021 RepID=UPI0036E42EB9